MREKIYEIPVRDAFAENTACPFCRLQELLDAQEIERISGAAMMEPDVRIETNARGFCEEHFRKLQKAQKALSLALILESHLDEVRKRCTDPAHKKTALEAEKIASSCYVCERVEHYMTAAYSAFLSLWKKDPDFRATIKSTEGFCLPHYAKMLAAAEELSRTDRKEYLLEVTAVMDAYLKKKREDISDFCKQFDYRFAGCAPAQKDAIAQAIFALTGGENPSKKEGNS